MSLLEYLHSEMTRLVTEGDQNASHYEDLIDAVRDADHRRACGIVVMNGLPDELGSRILKTFGVR